MNAGHNIFLNIPDDFGLPPVKENYPEEWSAFMLHS